MIQAEGIQELGSINVQEKEKARIPKINQEEEGLKQKKAIFQPKLDNFPV